MNFLKKNKIASIPAYKFILYFFVLLALLVFLYSIKTEINEGYRLSQDIIQNFIKDMGYLSWLAYIILVSLFVISPLPSTMLGIIAGYLFHPLAAILFGLIGETIGAAGNYYIGKNFSKFFTNKERFPRISKTIISYSKKLTQEIIFLLGMIPVSTSNLTGYAAAIGGIPFKKYIVPWISGIGIVVIITSLLGYSAKIQSKYFSLVLILCVCFYLFIKFIYKKYVKNKIT
jgi:uncharacterized membrane protein YdjX (TVP38/TMEM64 family)